MSDSSQTLVYDAVDVLCREMTAQWENGSCPAVETFLERLGETPVSEDAVRLIYEEICIRQDRGDYVTLDELESRFPQWMQELEVLLDCHRLLRSRPSTPIFPAVGEVLGDFRLVQELGRGAQGVVYLARQQTLSDRPVVLKLSQRKTREHLSLARLQHTHIIPLHAIYEFPARNLIAMCQPYLGGTTLEHILDKLKDIPLNKRTGQSILHVLDAEQMNSHQENTTHSSFRRLLTLCSYVDAICLIGACLADGLQYAHEHDLVHLDIKPSNVLLTADAQPMLLDFHLALQPLSAGASAPEWFGGTPAYVAPEHAAACYAARHGRPLPEAVGPSADLYSLGKLLYVALAGAATGTTATVSALRNQYPEVGTGLSDIIQKCMQPDPKHRYPSAMALATDLRRHLGQLPLLGVPNRNWHERWQKWKRRTPFATLVVGMVFALISGFIILSVMIFDRVQNAENDLLHGQELLKRGFHSEALYTLSHGKERLQVLPGFSGLRSELDHAIMETNRGNAVANLTKITEKLQYRVEKTNHATADQQAWDAQCKTMWDQRELIAGPNREGLTEMVRETLMDFVVLWLETNNAGMGNKEDPRGLAIIAEAEQLLGSSPILERQRRLVQGKENDAVGIEQAGSAWEKVIWGRSLLRSGEWQKAASLFQKAVDARPDDFWPNYYLGICSYQMQQYQEALRWFSVAVALAPGSAECYYNRGLTFLALDHPDQACHEYDKALEVRPDFGAASLNRGHIYYSKKEYPKALADFEHALNHGAVPVLAHYNLALCQLALENVSDAIQHLRVVLELNPQHTDAQQLLKQLQQKPKVRLK